MSPRVASGQDLQPRRLKSGRQGRLPSGGRAECYRGWHPGIAGEGQAPGSGTVTSTISAPSADTRSPGARWRFTPLAPPPIATTGRPIIAASAITGQARVEPNGVLV